jgi:hypothetical protein
VSAIKETETEKGEGQKGGVGIEKGGGAGWDVSWRRGGDRCWRNKIKINRPFKCSVNVVAMLRIP